MARPPPGPPDLTLQHWYPHSISANRGSKSSLCSNPLVMACNFLPSHCTFLLRLGAGPLVSFLSHLSRRCQIFPRPPHPNLQRWYLHSISASKGNKSSLGNNLLLM